MKKAFLFVLLFTTQLTFAQKVSFRIIKDKTEVDNIGAITLHVEVINTSGNDVTILKPATDFRQKWRYYDVTIKCNDIPLWEVPAKEQEKIAYNESDLLVIPSKSKVEIIINGRQNANMLACNSKIFQLKLTYDAGKLIENSSSESLIVKKLTTIKIESIETRIEIH